MSEAVEPKTGEEKSTEKPGPEKPKRRSMLLLFFYALGRFVGRRRLVAAFMLGLDDGVTDRAYRSRHGKWPEEESPTPEHLVAVAAAIASEIQAQAT